MAEQVLPVRRFVALKVIKPGMDTKEIIARFESERQALALMEHPNIARVLDAGATETGLPYFVMELVRGVPITEYADANQLTPRERLELFVTVCGAIQHAHQKGVIHRDLKPSNILVTLHDGVPVPKVIDFGIAKATSARLTEKTLFTRFGHFVGTPAYMSPEQAEMSGLDVDTRSDIYSLGILLYELLTGTTPLSTEELRAAGYAEIQRRIRELEAQRPSTRVRTLNAETRTAVARRRGIDPDQLARALRGDLDWIVLRSLEKDRTRRYETPMDLARDIGRHLRLEPVEARPASRLYRLQKLVQRNKLACTAAALVLFSLVAGLGFSTWMYLRERIANGARQAAQATAVDEADIKDAVSRFLMEDVLEQADSFLQVEAGAEPRPDLTVREAVARAAVRVGERFQDRPVVEAAIRKTLATAFFGTGAFKEALPHLERSLALFERERGPSHESALEARIGLARTYRELGRLEEALAIHQRFREEHEPRLGPSDPLVISNLTQFAVALRNNRQLEESLAVIREALQSLGSAKGLERQELILLTGLTSLLHFTGKTAAAISAGEEALRRLEEVLPRDHPETLDHRNVLGATYVSAGQTERGIAFIRETIAMVERVRGPNHPQTVDCRLKLAFAYGRARQFDEAIALHRELEPLYLARLGPNHTETLGNRFNLAQALRSVGRAAEAVTLLEEIVKRLQAMPVEHLYLHSAQGELALVYRDLGRWEDSVRMGELAVAGYERKLDPESVERAGAVSRLAWSYRLAGHFAKALERFRQTLEWQERHLGVDHAQTASTRAGLAGVMVRVGQVEEGVRLGEQAYRLLVQKIGPGHPDTVRARSSLARSYVLARRPPEAVELCREQLEIARKSDPADGSAVISAIVELAECLLAAGRPAEAEPILRENLALESLPWTQGPWGPFAQCLLGAALLARAQLDEAGALLVAGYQGMKEGEAKILPESTYRLPWALERLVELHEKRGDTAGVERWQSELESRRAASR